MSLERPRDFILKYLEMGRRSRMENKRETSLIQLMAQNERESLKLNVKMQKD